MNLHGSTCMCSTVFVYKMNLVIQRILHKIPRRWIKIWFWGIPTTSLWEMLTRFTAVIWSLRIFSFFKETQENADARFSSLQRRASLVTHVNAFQRCLLKMERPEIWDIPRSVAGRRSAAPNLRRTTKYFRLTICCYFPALNYFCCFLIWSMAACVGVTFTVRGERGISVMKRLQNSEPAHWVREGSGC